MATYDVSDHPLFSSKAKELDPNVLSEHIELAEDLLGLTGTAYTGASLPTAKRASVLQVNHQVEQGTSAAVYKEEKDGDHEVEYLETVLNPAAVALVASIVTIATSDEFETILSLR